MQETISLEGWNSIAIYIAAGFAGIGVLIMLVHWMKLSSTKDFKAKYDYINAKEINLLWTTSIALIAARDLACRCFRC